MRKKRPIERKPTQFRDSTLVVIASEDGFAVKQYFERFQSTQIQIRVLETESGHSSPALVLDRLATFMKEYEFGQGDEFWLVCDTDHWIDSGHIHNLKQVVQLCRQKDIHVALSNPCFDLWLLLHFAEFPDQGSLNCKSVGAKIREVVGAFNKTKVFNLPFDDGLVSNALRRSTARPPQGDIPTEMYTAVHKLIGPLIKRFGLTIVR